MSRHLLAFAAIFLFFFPALTRAQGDGYIGPTQCYACHKQIKQAYMGNRHGKVFTGEDRNGLQARGCEACHGPGAAHREAVDREEKDLKIESFKKGREVPAEMNKRCLECHEKGKVQYWQGAPHDMAGLACATCHRIHGPNMIPKMDVCFNCHKERRAQLQRSSHMPLREGKITCFDCHNPHGGPGPSNLKYSSVNDTCYTCHPDKRGPVIWEHQPVRENCANCHDPHGSNLESLLKNRVPYLCQSCHDMANHPSTIYDASKIPGGGGVPAQQLLGKGCLNCHSQIHGSNHPSGARFQR